MKVKAPGDWLEAVLNIEILPGFSSYKGYYLTPSGKKNMSIFGFPYDTGDHLHTLHRLTSDGVQLKWNKAKLRLIKGHVYKLEFLWDQKWQDEVDAENAKQARRFAESIVGTMPIRM